MRIGLNKSTKTAKVHAFPGNRVITRKKLANSSSRTGLGKKLRKEKPYHDRTGGVPCKRAMTTRDCPKGHHYR